MKENPPTRFNDNLIEVDFKESSSALENANSKRRIRSECDVFFAEILSETPNVNFIHSSIYNLYSEYEDCEKISIFIEKYIQNKLTYYISVGAETKMTTRLYNLRAVFVRRHHDEYTRFVANLFILPLEDIQSKLVKIFS